MAERSVPSCTGNALRNKQGLQGRGALHNSQLAPGIRGERSRWCGLASALLWASGGKWYFRLILSNLWCFVVSGVEGGVAGKQSFKQNRMSLAENVKAWSCDFMLALHVNLSNFKHLADQDFYVVKPDKTVPIFSWTPGIGNMKFSTAASVFTAEAIPNPWQRYTTSCYYSFAWISIPSQIVLTFVRLISET